MAREDKRNIRAKKLKKISKVLFKIEIFAML